MLNASLLYTVQEHGDSADPAAAAAAIAAENAARGETKVGARHASIEEFDVQELMSTTPEVNARFRVAWATEFQGMTLDDLTELSVLGQGTFKIEKLKCSNCITILVVIIVIVVFLTWNLFQCLVFYNIFQTSPNSVY